MTTLEARSSNHPTDATLRDALAYDAPFLIEKLVKDRIADSVADGEALFNEVKKYFVLSRSDRSRTWEMQSLRIDEVWHQFVLFTRQYGEFCQRFFGEYIHHSPGNSPDSKGTPSREVASFELFQHRYEEMFGVPIPLLWFDYMSVAPHRRVFNDRAGNLMVQRDGEMAALLTNAGDVVMSVSELASDALAFVARTGVFYVRELPGELNDEEKTALIAALVEQRVLRLAA